MSETHLLEGKHAERNSDHPHQGAMEDHAETELQPNEVFGLLQNPRRYQALQYLAEMDTEVTSLDELADHVAAAENDTDVSQLSSAQRKRAYISLYQSHLPRMDQVGVLQFDRDRGTVVQRDMSQVEPYISESESDVGSPVPAYIAFLVGGITILGVLNVGPMATVPAGLWAMLSASALIGVAVYLIRHTARSTD